MKLAGIETAISASGAIASVRGARTNAGPQKEFAGFVLRGGRSTRMGQDKAELQFGRRTLSEHAVSLLKQACVEVWQIGGVSRRSRSTLPDLHPGCGPLGGIVSGLYATAVDWNLFLAVDTPFVPVPVLEALLTAAVPSSAVAVMARVRGQVQPLCAAYSRRALNPLKAELEAGRLKVTKAAAAAGPVEYVDFDDPGWFRNLNTPEDYQEAMANLAAMPRAVPDPDASKEPSYYDSEP